MIIIDTGAFVALFNRRDSAHLAAQRAFETIQEPMITTFPVITETCYFLAATVSHTAQSNFLKSFVLGAFQIFDLEPTHIDRMIVKTRPVIIVSNNAIGILPLKVIKC